MAAVWIVYALFLTVTDAAEIALLHCEPPDQPRYGGYGPRIEKYFPGDSIHYFCDTETFIGGNFYRKCEDTGDWSGNTPVCDTPSTFSFTNQSSAASNGDDAERAVDGWRTTCTSTRKGEKGEWYGKFITPGQLIRVMIFFPKGPVSFEVVLVKASGEEVICGSQTTNIDRYDWTFQNCPEPNNTGASGLKIRSLTTAPLRICEIAAYVLTSPKCVDPHLYIENGRVRLDRKVAILTCDKGYLRGPDNKVQCIREGVWNRKFLFCMPPQFERNNRDEDPSSEESEPLKEDSELP